MITPEQLVDMCQRETTQNRFWKFVRKSADSDGCWNWTATRKALGQDLPASFWLNGENVQARHVIWATLNGEWPGSKIYCTCGNVCCIRPEHLTLAAPSRPNARKSLTKEVKEKPVKVYRPKPEPKPKAVKVQRVKVERPKRIAPPRSQPMRKSVGRSYGLARVQKLAKRCGFILTESGPKCYRLERLKEPELAVAWLENVVIDVVDELVEYV